MRADLWCYSYSCGGKSFSCLGFQFISSVVRLLVMIGIFGTVVVLSLRSRCWLQARESMLHWALYGMQAWGMLAVRLFMGGGGRALVSMHGMVLYWVG